MGVEDPCGGMNLHVRPRLKYAVMVKIRAGIRNRLKRSPRTQHLLNQNH